MVQCNVFKVWEFWIDFCEEFLVDEDVVKVFGVDGINEKFDMGYYIKYVDMIFKCVFGES